MSSTDVLNEDFLRQFMERVTWGGGFEKKSSGIYTDAEMNEKLKEYSERLSEYNREEEYSILLTKKLKELKEEEKALNEEILALMDELHEAELKGEDTIEIEEKIRGFQEQRLKTLKEITKIEKEAPTPFSRVLKDSGTVLKTIKEIGGEFNRLLEPWKQADEAAVNYAKSLGMTKKAMNEFRQETLKNTVRGSLSVKYNISNEELMNAQLNYMKGTGRNIKASNANQEDMAAIKMVYGDSGLEMAAQWENFGMSISKSGEHLSKMYKEASKYGISLQKYSENVSKNIHLAQNYTFKNGMKGLESMAKKATALKLDMQQVANFAEKVSTVEGAIETAAKLQVLGGPFAQIADPLGMLNEGLNDMEGLHDRMARMVKNLGHFNKQTGEVEISSYDKTRIKVAASAMGVDYNQLMQTVNRQTLTGEIGKQLNASINKNLSDEMKELIKNQGTIEGGKAGVSINGKFKTIDELTNKDYNAIKAETNTEAQNIRDIAMDVRSLNDIIKGIEKQSNSYLSRIFGWIGVIGKGVLGLTGIAATIAALITASKIIGGGFSIGKTFSKFGNKGAINKMKGAAQKMGGFFKKGGGKTGLPEGIGRNASGRLYDLKTGKFVSEKSIATGSKKAVKETAKKAVSKTTKETAKKAVSKTTKETAKKATSSILKRGGKRAVTRAGAKVAGKFGAKLATGVAKGGPLGIIGAIGDIATEALVDSGKMKKGGVGHHVGKGLSGAAQGAAIGMLLGPWGAAAGAIIGGTIGLVKAGKAKQERILDEKLEGTGIKVKGKYSRSKLKEINEALSTGKISRKMRKTLEKKGDDALLNKIDEKAKQKRDKRRERIKESVDGIKTIFGRGSDIKKNDTKLKVAHFKVDNAYFNGGIGGEKKGFKALDGTPIGSIQSLKGKILGHRPSLIKGKKEIGIPETYEGIRLPKFKDLNLRRENSSTDNEVPKSFDINIKGELKLTGDNGQSVDIIKYLRNNSQVLRSLADLISKEIGKIDNGSTIVNKG